MLRSVILIKNFPVLRAQLQRRRATRRDGSFFQRRRVNRPERGRCGACPSAAGRRDTECDILLAVREVEACPFLICVGIRVNVRKLKRAPGHGLQGNDCYVNRTVACVADIENVCCEIACRVDAVGNRCRVRDGKYGCRDTPIHVYRIRLACGSRR